MGRRKGLLSAIITVAQVLVLAIIITLSHTGARAKAAGSIDITGTVINSSGGGVDNASVYATDPGTSNVDFGPITTASDGSYDLQVSAGTYDFHFVPPGGSGLSPIVDSNVTVLNDQTINIQLINSTNTLSGTVLNADGSPAVGVEVVATSDSNDNPYFGTTNSSGAYSIQVPPDTYSVGAEVFHYVPGSSPQQYISTTIVYSSSRTDLTSGGANVNLQLPDTTATLTVTVQDGHGNPVPGTQVSLTSQNGPCSGGQCSSVLTGDLVSGGGDATVGSSGQINFSVMPNVNINTGALCAYFSATGLRVCNTSPITVSSSGAALTLAEASTNTLSGTVLNADGSPAVGVEVVATSDSNDNPYFGTTNSSGAYSIQVPPDTYSVGAEVFHYVPGSSPQQYISTTIVYSSSRTDLTSGGANVNLQLPDTTATLTVTVQDGHGNPVPGTQVSLTSQNGPCSGGQCSSVLTGDLVSGGGDATVGSSGQINFSVMPNVNINTGALCAYFSATGLRVCNTSPITVSSSGAALTLAEASTNTLSGTVLNADGSPAVGVEVVATSDSNDNPYFGTTNSSGAYSIQVPPDTYSVGAEVFHYVPGSSPQQYISTTIVYSSSRTDLTSGGANVNLQLPDTTATLTVTVQDGHGNPVPGTQVSLTSQNGPCSGGQCSSVLTGDLVSGGGDATVGSSGQINFSVMPNVNINTGALCAYFSATGLRVCNTSPITVSSSGAALVFSEQPPMPQPPTALSAPSPTNQPPALSWTEGSTTNNPAASYYNIYRNGTDIGSSSTTSFTDTNAPTGTNSYYVTAVSLNGVESAQSNSISVIYDTTPPTITYTVSPSPNSAGWNNTPVTVTFSCNDSGTGVGIASCTSPVTLSNNGSNQTVTGTAVDNAGNTASVTTVHINIDQSVPMVGTPSWSTNPVVTGNTTTLTDSATPSDTTLSPIVGGEYYIGNTDPGQGNGTAMTYSTNTGNLTATLGTSPTLSPGTYTVHVRAVNAAGQWSSTVSTTLTVKPSTVAPTITSTNSYTIGVRQIITPTDFTVTTTGTPTASITESGALPSGLSFTDNGNGTANFTGMVAAGTQGTFHITITASNGTSPNATQSFTLTITNTDSAPTTIFPSTSNLTFPQGSAMSLTFTSTGNGKNFKIFLFSGTLPPGLNLHDNKDGTATFFGTPTTKGTYTFTLEAENGDGVTYQSFTVVVD